MKGGRPAGSVSRTSYPMMIRSISPSQAPSLEPLSPEQKQAPASIPIPAHVSLKPIHAFGTNFALGIQDTLFFYEEDQQQKLLYPVGRHIAIRECQSSQMKFIFIPDSVERVTAMQLTPNRRFLATAEKCHRDPQAYLSFYDIQTRTSKLRIPFRSLGMPALDVSSSVSQQPQPNSSNTPSLLLQQSQDQHSQHQQYLAPVGASSSSLHGPGSSFDIVSFSFSSDSKFVACVGSDGSAVLWDWYNKNKQLGSAVLGQGSVTRITIDPKDNHCLCTSGYQLFRLWRVQENVFKPLPPVVNLPTTQVFSDHAWLDEERLLTITDVGEIYIIENNEVRQHITRAFRESEPLPITAIRAYSRGFFLGSDEGTMALWMKSDESTTPGHKQVYEFVRKWLPGRKRNCRVNGLAVSTSEETLAVAFNDNDLGISNISSILQNGVIAGPQSNAPTGNSFSQQPVQQEVVFDFLCSGFHTSNITGLDVSMQRPLIASSSKEDSTIRIWNYLTLRCQLARQFYVVQDLAVRESTRPLLSLALHPNGYYIAAGFLDRIRFFHILHNELRIYRELQLGGCHQLRFSNNGHLFAAAELKCIRVYGSFTLEHIITLSGFHARITSLSFSSNDSYLTAVTADGNLQLWSSSDWDNTSECYSSASTDSTFTSTTAFNDENPFAISIGAHLSTKQGLIVETGKFGKESKRILVPGVRYTQSISVTSELPLVGKVSDGSPQKSMISSSTFTSLLCGTQNGRIQIFALPLKNNHTDAFTSRCLESISVHSGEVSKLKLSPDGKYVFSGGHDGAIFVHAVQEVMEDGSVMQAGQRQQALIERQTKSQNSSLVAAQEESLQKKVTDEALADVLLVKRHDLSKFQKRHEDLLSKKTHLDRQIEYQRNENRKQEQQKLRNEKEALSIELHQAQMRFENLFRQKQIQDEENIGNAKRLEAKHLGEIKELQARYDKKIAIETENTLKLEQEKLEKKQEYEARIAKLKSMNEETADDLRQDFAKNLSVVKSECHQTKNTAETLRNIYEERLMQQEEEHEMEIQELKIAHVQLIEKLRKDQADEQEKNQTKKTKRKEILAAKDDLERKKTMHLKNRSDLEEKIEEKTRQIAVLEKDIEESMENLKKKNNKLYEYRFKIKDLQKSKHVLTFRTTEMKESLEPKEAQIEKLSEQLLVLEGEFETQLKNMNELVGNLNQLENQIIQLRKDRDKQKELTMDRNQTIFNFRRDVFLTVAMKEDKEFIKDLKKLNEVYVLATHFEQQERAKREQESIQEMDRQLRQMEKSISTLRSNAKKHDERTRVDLKKRTTENAQLIHDLNQLRVIKKRLLVQRGEIKAKLAQYEQPTQSIKEEEQMGIDDSSEESKDLNIEMDSVKDDQAYRRTEESGHMPPLMRGLFDSGVKGFEQFGGQQSQGSLGEGAIVDSKQKTAELTVRTKSHQMQLEKNNEQIMYQKLEIKRLQEQINEFMAHPDARPHFSQGLGGGGLLMRPVMSYSSVVAPNKMRIPTTEVIRGAAATLPKVPSQQKI